jgi:Tol biopolymer transport system component
VLRRCLEKNPRNRLSAIGDARLELEERDEAAPAGAVSPSRSRAWQAAVLVAAIAGASGMTWLVSSWLRSSPQATLSRTSVLPPDGTTLFRDSTGYAISPDGHLLAFVTGELQSGRKTGLWLRSLDSVTARLLAGTEGASLPFWSPDSRHLAFFTGDGKLKKIGVDGGPIEEICDAKEGRGGTWSPKGVIVFAPNVDGPLMQVPPGGGTPRGATALDAARSESAHRFPQFLPDGDHFLYAALPAHAGAFDVFIGSISDSTPVLLLAAQGTPTFVPPDRLVFLRRGTLLSQRFDPARRLLGGEPASVTDVPGGVDAGYTGHGAASASTNGTLAYLRDQGADVSVMWLDQSGRQIGKVAVPPGKYTDVSMARDGRLGVLARQTSATFSDLWRVDLEHGGASRIVDAPGNNRYPVLSPDGERFVFCTDRDGPEDVFVKSTTDAAPEQPVLRSKVLFKRPASWSMDGRFVVFQEFGLDVRSDLSVITMADRTSKTYSRTPAYERVGAISPDNQWMAYVADDTGRNEMYVQAFPTPGRKHRISSDGAKTVWWRRDGKQLLFTNDDNTELLVADVDTRGEFSSSAPRVVGHLPKRVAGLDVTPDLQRILALVNEASTVPLSITVVQNWTAPAR